MGFGAGVALGGRKPEHPEDRAEAPDSADADQGAGEEDNLLLQAGENA